MQKKVVIFDFDGVLANTLELSYQIHKDVNNNLTLERFRELSRGNFIHEYNKMVKEEGYIGPDDFWNKYDSKLATLSIHEILHDAVLALAQQFRLYVVSSTSEYSIRKFLEKENLSELFVSILGMEIHSSKVTKIKSILETESLQPDSAVFITDTLGDIEEANECRVRSVAVTWGHHEIEMLREGNPAKIINDPQELVPAIKEVLEIAV